MAGIANSIYDGSINSERLPLLGNNDQQQATARNRRVKWWSGVQGYAQKLVEMGRSDPRKLIFAIKKGLALGVVSLLLFWQDKFHDFRLHSIWAILTVVVMFEFSVGSTLIKGFNRLIGTVFAGMIAFGFAQILILVGSPWARYLTLVSICIVGSCAAYLKLYPTMTQYEYGYRVFVMTFCVLILAGESTREYTTAILTRLGLIGVGALICFVVNTCVYPIWAGDDLHRLVVKNFNDVASSLEGCVNGYLNCFEYKRFPSRIVTFQASDDPLYSGYRSVVESTSREQTLLGFALWEPAHGRYRISSYPWRNYVKVSGALRHCVFMVMALHGCILSEIQAPAERRRVFRNEIQRVGVEGARVLQEIGQKLERMEKLSAGDILLQVHEAAENLQRKVDQKSHILVNAESWILGRQKSSKRQEEDSERYRDENDSDQNDHLGSRADSVVSIPVSIPPTLQRSDSSEFLSRQESAWPLRFSFLENGGIKEDEIRIYESASALSLATFASLLIEFVARLQNLVDAYAELSNKAEFKDPSMVRGGESDEKGVFGTIFGSFMVKR